MTIIHYNESILRNRYLCSEHFDKKYIQNESGQRKRLSKFAIPFHYKDDICGRVRSHSPVPSTSQEDAELNSNGDGTDSDVDDGPHCRAGIAEAVQEVPRGSGARDGLQPRLLHEGCICKFCQKEIIGFRYSCVQCVDVNLCSTCEARGEHNLHYVLRIPTPRPQGEVESVLCRVRRELQAGLLPVVDCAEHTDVDRSPDTDSIKIEVKEEPDPGPDPLQDSSHNPVYDTELTSDLDIKYEEEWLDEAMEEQEDYTVLTHIIAADTTTDRIPQKRSSQNITACPDKKPHLNIQSNAPSCSESRDNIDKRLKVVGLTPLNLNEPLNFDVFTHSEKQTNEATRPRPNEKGSSVKKKKKSL